MAWEKFWERHHTRRPFPSLTEAIKAYGKVVQFPQPQYVQPNHCKWCNAELPAGHTAFCSKECSNAFNQVTVWNRGRSAYPLRILYRDNFTCQRCGIFMGFVNKHGVIVPIDDSHYSTEVHHLQPVSLGGGDEPENLVTLCGECHREVHRQQSLTGVLWHPKAKN